MENKANLSIAEQNANKLSAATAAFCNNCGIDINPLTIVVIGDLVMTNIAKWYVERGRGDVSLKTELVADEAVEFAFAEIFKGLALAAISKATGIGME